MFARDEGNLISLPCGDCAPEDWRRQFRVQAVFRHELVKCLSGQSLRADFQGSRTNLRQSQWCWNPFTPPANWPMASIFCDWWNCSSSFSPVGDGTKSPDPSVMFSGLVADG